MFPLSPPLKAVSQGSSESQILDLSNRFYTLIPHDFGMKKPPLLNNTDSVQVARGPRREPGCAGLGCQSGCCPLRPLHIVVPEGQDQCWEGPLRALVLKGF